MNSLTVIACLGLGLVFFLFLKTMAVAAIISMAAWETIRRYRECSIQKQKYFNVATVCVGIGFLTLVITSGKNIGDIFRAVLDASWINETDKNVRQFLLTAATGLENWLQPILHNFDLGAELRGRLPDLINRTLNVVSSNLMATFSALPLNILQLTLFLFIVFSFYRKIPKIFAFLKAHQRDSKYATGEFLLKASIESSYTAFMANVVVGAAQAACIGLGAAVVGITYWPLVLFASFFCSFVPMIGLLPMGILCAITTFDSNGMITGIVFLVFWGAATLIDNILRPMIIAQEDPVFSSFIRFFGLIGGIFMLGFPGLFIGPFLLLLCERILKKILA